MSEPARIEFTDSEKFFWIVKYYGSRDGGQPDEDYTVFVLADTAEAAISKVRAFHDPAAVIESLSKEWLLE